MDNHYVAVVQLLQQLLATFLVMLYDFHAYVVGLGMSHMYGDVSAAHDHGLAHIGIVLLAHNLANEWNMLAGGHEIGDVSQKYLRVSVGDDCCLSPFQSHYVEWRGGAA